MSAALRGFALLTGLAGYGFSMAMMVRAGLGLDPWDVFHQGLTRHTPMTIGVASAVVGVVVLLAWIPLRKVPEIFGVPSHHDDFARPQRQRADGSHLHP